MIVVRQVWRRTVIAFHCDVLEAVLQRVASLVVCGDEWGTKQASRAARAGEAASAGVQPTANSSSPTLC